jgi:manganese/iron transport system permease protein
MIVLSSCIGVISGIVGLFVSYHSDVAAGGTIVLVATAIFTAAWLFAPEHGFVTSRILRRRMAAGHEPESRIVFESPEIQTPGRH